MVLVPTGGACPELPLFLVLCAALPEGKKEYKSCPLKGPRGLALPFGGLFLQRMKVKLTQSCPTLCKELYSPWTSPGHNTGVDSLSLLRGIFSTQGSNPGLQHCRWILDQLSHKGSPRILV